MKKLSVFFAAILLMAALVPAARAEALTYGRFTVTFAPGGVTVAVKDETAPIVTLECDSFLRMVSKAYPISFEQADDVSGLVKISKKSYQDSKYGTEPSFCNESAEIGAGRRVRGR